MELSVGLLLVVVSVSLAQEDLEGKMFVFPKETNTAHVILRPTNTRPLQEVSVCLRTYSELSHQYSLFSLVNPTYRNAFLIRFQAPTTYTVYINHESSVFKRDSEPQDRSHTCVTWDSRRREVQLWVNGKITTKGYIQGQSSIMAKGSIILGQDQGFYGGGFDASQSLVGEISDVHMWDYVLTPENIRKVASGNLYGNILSWKSLLYEMKGEVLVQPKNLHLENKVFVFPKETNTAYVILKPTITRPLQEVSVCLSSYTDLSRTYTPFSLATPGKDNAFLIYLQPPNICSIHINQQVTKFKTDSESLDWRHICVTWDSNTGVVQLWVNGKLYPRRVSMKGSSIAAEASIVLGQEQDTFGGHFDVSQSLVGEISDVHMWDYALTPRDVQKVISGALFGNVINLKSVVYEIKGEVLIQPKP